MNDLFDRCNGRSLKDAIFNDPAKWANKRKVFDQKLEILNNTERMYRKMEAERKLKEKEMKRREREKKMLEKKGKVEKG